MAGDDDKEGWIRRVLGFESGAERQGPGSQTTASPAAGLPEGAAPPASYVGVEVGIVAEQIEQTGLGLLDRAGQGISNTVDSVKDKLGWGAPQSRTPTGPVTLTSKTEEAQPAPRTRLKLGVGERVELKVTGGSGTWQTSAGRLSARTGATVTLTAPERPSTAVVTVDVGGTTRSLTFNVIAPNVINMRRATTNHQANGLPNAGMTTSIHAGPDDVNFSHITFREDDVGANASGYWAPFNGIGHSPNPAPLGFSNVVAAGLGTAANANDNCQSGWIPVNPPLTDWTGQLTFDIPWRWQCGSGAGLIARVLHRVVTDKAGTTTISKAGASFTAAKTP